MNKVLIENRITRMEKRSFTCHLCNYSMENAQFRTNVREHLASNMHQEKLNQIDSETRRIASANFLQLAAKSNRKSIVKHLITFNEDFTLLVCIPCNCKISGFQETLLHIQNNEHNKELKKYRDEHRTAAVDRQVEVPSSDEDSGDKTTVEKPFVVETSSFAPQSRSNDIIYDENSNTHYCSVCNMEIAATPNISEHIQGLLHHAYKSKLKVPISNSNPEGVIYDDKSNSYNCTICNLKIDSTASVIEQHIQGFMHQIMLGTQKAMEIKNATCQNQEVPVQKHTNARKVHQAVEVDSKNQEVPVQKHINAPKVPQTVEVDSKNHDNVLKKSHFTKICYCHACRTFLGNSTMLRCHVMLHLHEESDTVWYSDLIRIQKEDKSRMLNVKCVLCATNIFAARRISRYSKELELHLKSKQHLDRLALFNYNENNTQIPVMNLDNIKSDDLTYNPEENISLELFCNVCNVPVTLCSKRQHELGRKHTGNFSKSKSSFTKTIDRTEFHSKSNLDLYACFLCSLSFSNASNLLEHYKTHEHQWKMTSLYMLFYKCPYIKFTKGNTNTLQCTQCKVIMHDVKSAVEHVLGSRHNEKFKFPLYNLKNQHNYNNGLLAGVTNQFETLTLTSIRVPVVKMTNVRKVKDVSQFQASVQELNQLGFGTENIKPLSVLNPNTVDSTLNALVPLDFSNKQIRRLPCHAKPKAPRTPKTEDQQKSFAANVVYHGNNYVKFCIDKGQENIYNFDSDKMNLLQLGVNLTFPYNYDRVCIPCGQIFSDDIQSLFEHLQNREHVKSLCDSMINDKEFEQVPEQFSDLRLAKLYMHVTDQAIQCNACNVEIDESDEAIRQHVKESVHKDKCKLWKEESEELFNQYSMIYKDIWYHAQFYFCELCKKRYDIEMDFVMHLTHPEHMKTVYELKFKGTALTFDLCSCCVTYLFGKTDSLEAHYQSNFHKRFAKNNDFMIPNLTLFANEYLENMNENADLLVEASDKANLEKDKEVALLKAIVEAVKPAYPNAQAYVFGSRLSDLGFPESDVDVFLDCESTYYTSSSKEQSQQFIKSIKEYFESMATIWVVDEVLLATRIPIMKLRHIPTNLKCDINVTNGLGIEKSKLLGLYNRAFPLCRKLILFMKKWLTVCRIFGSDYITTFSISWCVIFYLQLQGILPSVYELIKQKNESEIVDGWECGFEENIEAKNSHLSFKEHLKGFFTYFANFDYRKSVICPYLGNVVDKHRFVYTNEVPQGMELYKKRLNNHEVEIFRFDSPMCIQDPIDLSQNLTKAVKKLHLRYFRQYCLVSAKKCQ